MAASEFGISHFRRRMEKSSISIRTAQSVCAGVCVAVVGDGV